MDRSIFVVSLPVNRSLNLFSCCLSPSTSVPAASPLTLLVKDIVASAGSASAFELIRDGSVVTGGETSPLSISSTAAGWCLGLDAGGSEGDSGGGVGGSGI